MPCIAGATKKVLARMRDLISRGKKVEISFFQSYYDNVARKEIEACFEISETE